MVAKRNAKPQHGSSRGVSPSRKPWLVQALELGTAAHGCRAVDQRQKPDFQPWIALIHLGKIIVVVVITRHHLPITLQGRKSRANRCR